MDSNASTSQNGEMKPARDYLEKCKGLIEAVSLQEDLIGQAAELFSRSILAGRLVHIFGSGHSRIPAEEMWPRYGSFPGFHPIVELSLTYHNQVVGANGQRQAMYIENVSGLAEKILRNFDISPEDCALVISCSGCNTVPIEMAEGFQSRGLKVVAIAGCRHMEATESKHPAGRKLSDFSDLLLDTGVPPGDSMVSVDGLKEPVSPGSSIGSILLVNAIKAEVALRLTAAGAPPRVLAAACVVGQERAEELFDSAYDEHARRVARLYKDLGAANKHE